MTRRLICVLVSCAGCGDPLQVYALSGQLYEIENDCLREEQVIDVIEGTASDACEGVRCIRSVETGDHFITTACEVPELYEDLTDVEDGPCAAALAAHELGDDAKCE